MKTRSGATLRQALDRLITKEELREAGLSAVGGMDIHTAERILVEAIHGTSADYVGGGFQPPPQLTLGGSTRPILGRRLPRRKSNRNDRRFAAQSVLRRK